MPFFLLEFAMQAVERDCAIGPDLSEASENRSDGRPKSRAGTAMDSQCKAQGRKPAARSKRERPRIAASGRETVAGERTQNRIDEVRLDS
jgi:hypothetical protein